MTRLFRAAAHQVASAVGAGRCLFTCDIWERPVLKYMDGLNGVCVADLLHYACGVERRNATVFDRSRVIAILHHAGWRRHRMRTPCPHWLYVRPGALEECIAADIAREKWLNALNLQGAAEVDS